MSIFVGDKKHWSNMKIDSKAKVRDIAGEKVVIMQGRLGADLTRIIQLNGSSVWLLEQLADRDFEVADVVALLTSRYDVDEQTATTDAAKWVEQLRENKIVIG
jgi:hypothetical protein